ncbi:putative Cyclin-like superfamily [Helianthus annuus]|nr:putative Cyclin-like superfamily [Helianthus annuus]
MMLTKMTNLLGEYIDDIYAHYKKQEILSCVRPSYMSQHRDITDRMRGLLIDG